MSTNHTASFLKPMAVLEDGRSKRVSSWDRSGANVDYVSIEPGETKTLAEVDGAGCVNKTYATVFSFDRLWLRKLVLRMFWDGEENPSVEVPFGDFYGVSNCIHRYFTSLCLAVYQGAYSIVTMGYNSYFPMPFGDGMRIEVTNEGELPIPMFWYHIDYEEWNETDASLGRFHAQFRRENLTQAVDQPAGLWTGQNIGGEENYVILEAEGKGHYVGCLLNVDNVTGGWWGEGDDMIFIDGDEWPPSLHGTGTEEIFGGGACPNIEYAGLYSGFHLISNPDWSGKNGMYRFFLTDPIRFQESIRVTIEHGHNNNLSNDYSSVAYWYQREPHRPSAILPVQERIPLMPDAYWELENKDREARSLLLPTVLKIAEEVEPKDQYKAIGHLLALHKSLAQVFDAQDYERAGKLADELIEELKKAQ
jgi:hypothetical protein